MGRVTDFTCYLSNEVLVKSDYFLSLWVWLIVAVFGQKTYKNICVLAAGEKLSSLRN